MAEHLELARGEGGARLAAAGRRRRPAPRRHPLPDPGRPRRRAAAPSERGLAAAPGHRPWDARGDLHLRPRRQRPRAVLGPPARAVAAQRRRQGRHDRRLPGRDRPRRPALRGAAIAVARSTAADGHTHRRTGTPPPTTRNARPKGRALRSGEEMYVVVVRRNMWPTRRGGQPPATLYVPGSTRTSERYP